jgi:putative DNA primase/helicase
MTAHQTIEDAARAALLELGLSLPKSFEPDKVSCRIDDEDGKRGNGAGSLKFLPMVRAAIAQNWKTGGAQKIFFLEW